MLIVKAPIMFCRREIWRVTPMESSQSQSRCLCSAGLTLYKAEMLGHGAEGAQTGRQPQPWVISAQSSSLQCFQCCLCVASWAGPGSWDHGCCHLYTTLVAVAGCPAGVTTPSTCVQLTGLCSSGHPSCSFINHVRGRGRETGCWEVFSLDSRDIFIFFPIYSQLTR